MIPESSKPRNTVLVWLAPPSPLFPVVIDEAFLWCDKFKKTICDALQARGFLGESPPIRENPNFKGDPDFLAFGDRAYATFYITNRRDGLLTICGGLKTLGFLAHAQVALADNAETWIWWWPPTLRGTEFTADEFLAQNWLPLYQKLCQ
jgi:hypothetical protein